MKVVKTVADYLVYPAMLSLFLLPMPGSEFDRIARAEFSFSGCATAVSQALRLQIQSLGKRKLKSVTIDQAVLELVRGGYARKDQALYRLNRGAAAGLEPEPLADLIRFWNTKPDGTKALEHVIDWNRAAKASNQTLANFVHAKIDSHRSYGKLTSGEKEVVGKRIRSCLEVRHAK